MSKAVLISIQPKWCEKILNGEKTIEIRKTKPNLKPPFKCYIYCTKAKTNLVQIMKDGDENYGEIYHGKPVFIKTEDGSVCDMYGKRQKVVAEFICDRIIGVDCDSVAPFDHYAKERIPESCVSRKELIAYSGMKLCFGWYISDLKVYDEPKPLSEFHKPCTPACNFSNECGGTDTKECMFGIERAPQSWCYVEETE